MADETKLGIIIEGVNGLSPILKQLQKDLQSFGKVITDIKGNFNDFNKNIKDISGQVKNSADTIKGSVAGITTTTTQLKTATSQTTESLDKLSTKLATTSRDLRSIGLGLSVAITAPLVLMGKQAISTAATFEQSMANAFSVMGDVSEQLKGQLEGVARELGANTVFTAGQAADAMYKLASSGLDVSQIMGSLPGILDLAAATQSDFAEVAEQTAVAMTVFGISADEANRITDSFATGIGKSNLTFARLRDSLKYAAPVMASFGKSLEETTAVLGMFANAGLFGRMAGTQLRGIMVDLAAPTAKMTSVFRGLGISMDELNPKIKSLGEIFDTIQESGISTSQIYDAFGKITGNAVALALESAETNGKKVSEMLSELESQMGATGAASSMAKIQIDTISGSWRMLVSATQEAYIAFQKDVFGDSIKNLLLWITDIIRGIGKLSPETKKLILIFASIAAALGPVILALSALTFALSTLTSVLGGTLVLFATIAVGVIAFGVAIDRALGLIFPDRIKMSEDARASIKDPIINALLATLEESEALIANIRVNINNALSGIGDEDQLGKNLADTIKQVKTATDQITAEIKKEGQARLDNLEILRQQGSVTETEYVKIKNAIVSNTDVAIKKQKELNDELNNMSNASFNITGVENQAKRLKEIIDEQRELMVKSLSESEEEFTKIQEAYSAGMLSIAEDRFKRLIELQDQQSSETVARVVKEANDILLTQDSLQKDLDRRKEEAISTGSRYYSIAYKEQLDNINKSFALEQVAINNKVKQANKAKDDIITIAAQQRISLNKQMAEQAEQINGIWDVQNQRILIGWDKHWFNIKAGASGGMQLLISIIKAFGKTMIDIFVLAGDGVLNYFKNLWSSLSTGWKALLKGDFKTVGTEALNLVSNLNPIAGIMDGMEKSAGEFRNKVKENFAQIGTDINDIINKDLESRGQYFNLDKEKEIIRKQLDDISKLPVTGGGGYMPEAIPPEDLKNIDEATGKAEDLEKVLKELGQSLEDLGVFAVREGGKVVATFNSIEDGIKATIKRMQELATANDETLADIGNLSDRIRADLGEIALSNEPVLKSFDDVKNEIKNIESAVSDLEKANKKWIDDANKGLKEYDENVKKINATFDDKIKDLEKSTAESLGKSVESTTKSLADKFFALPEDVKNVQKQIDDITEQIRKKGIEETTLSISAEVDPIALAEVGNELNILREREKELNAEMSKLSEFKTDFEDLQRSARAYGAEIDKIDQAIKNTDNIETRNQLEQQRTVLLGKQSLALGESEKLDELIAENKAKQQMSEIDFIAFKLGKEIEAINAKAEAENKIIEDKRAAELKSINDVKKIQEIISAGELDFIDVRNLERRGFSEEAIILATQAKAEFEIYKTKSIEQLGLLDKVKTAQLDLYATTNTELENQLISFEAYNVALEEQIRLLTEVKKAAEAAYAANPSLKLTGDSGIYLKPHAEGGYTGAGGVNQVAGVVHAGEWVAPQWMVRSYSSMFSMLENMRNSKGGRFEMPYKSGGFVSTPVQGNSSVFNFDFSGAVIADKDTFIRDIKNSINRDSELASQGA